MTPSQLTAQAFASYPPEARAVLTENLKILRVLPLSFLPLLLRETIGYDWKFPAERKELDQQFSYLRTKAADQITELMRPFAEIRLTEELAQFDWVNDPVQYSEKFSAYLWASHQMDAFRKASVDYVHELNAARQDQPLPVARVYIVVLGQQVRTTQYRLFRKLARHGTQFTNVDPEAGLAAIMSALSERVHKYPVPYAHWYVDGGGAPAGISSSVVTVSYDALQPVRMALINKMVKTMQPGGGGPELLRTELAQIKPAQLQFPDSLLNRFQLSVLTQGSGTQIFSTTFVQWTTREALRRAQPLTLVARFAPRQREAAVQNPQTASADLDPEGALIDADMASYYTWLNQQRLPGSKESRFLVWFEGHSQAIAVGPHWEAGIQDHSRLNLNAIVSSLI